MIDSSTLRYTAGHFATGVTVVTTRDTEGKCHGLTMNAVTCLSMDPPLFLICLDRKSDTLQPLLDSKVFAINVLSKDQESVSRAFALKGVDKFSQLSYCLGLLGAPILEQALASIECRVETTYDGGDHLIILGRVERAQANTGEPLLFYRGKYMGLSVPEVP